MNIEKLERHEIQTEAFLVARRDLGDRSREVRRNVARMKMILEARHARDPSIMYDDSRSDLTMSQDLEKAGTRLKQLEEAAETLDAKLQARRQLETACRDYIAANKPRLVEEPYTEKRSTVQRTRTAPETARMSGTAASIRNSLADGEN